MIRAKITPRVQVDGSVYVRIEWTNIVDEMPHEVICVEEFCIEKQKEGSSYFSRIAVEQATEMGATFWLDEFGLRHFYATLNPGLIGMTGNASG